VAYVGAVETACANRDTVRNVCRKRAKMKRLNGPAHRPVPGIAKPATMFSIIIKSNPEPSASKPSKARVMFFMRKKCKRTLECRRPKKIQSHHPNVRG
jgi:hypothetical protein